MTGACFYSFCWFYCMLFANFSILYHWIVDRIIYARWNASHYENHQRPFFLAYDTNIYHITVKYILYSTCRFIEKQTGDNDGVLFISVINIDLVCLMDSKWINHLSVVMINFLTWSYPTENRKGSKVHIIHVLSLLCVQPCTFLIGKKKHI